jgi:hypothetical protein
MGAVPRLSDIEGYLVLITPLSYDMVPSAATARLGGFPAPARELMRCHLVVLDPPIYGPRHMAVHVVERVVGADPNHRADHVLPAEFDEVLIGSVGIVAYCRQLDGTTAGRPYRYQRMGDDRKGWSVRPLTPSDTAIVHRYREGLG